MPNTEDEHKNAVEPLRRTHGDPVRFGAHLLQIIVVILIAYVVIHFIIKYW